MPIVTSLVQQLPKNKSPGTCTSGAGSRLQGQLLCSARLCPLPTIVTQFKQSRSSRAAQTHSWTTAIPVYTFRSFCTLSLCTHCCGGSWEVPLTPSFLQYCHHNTCHCFCMPTPDPDLSTGMDFNWKHWNWDPTFLTLHFQIIIC